MSCFTKEHPNAQSGFVDDDVKRRPFANWPWPSLGWRMFQDVARWPELWTKGHNVATCCYHGQFFQHFVAPWGSFVTPQNDAAPQSSVLSATPCGCTQWRIKADLMIFHLGWSWTQWFFWIFDWQKKMGCLLEFDPPIACSGSNVWPLALTALLAMADTEVGAAVCLQKTNPWWKLGEKTLIWKCPGHWKGHDRRRRCERQCAALVSSVYPTFCGSFVC